MSWFTRKESAAGDAPTEPQMFDVEMKLAALEVRADHVEAELTSRNRRDHWTETVEGLIWARGNPVPKKGS